MKSEKLLFVFSAILIAISSFAAIEIMDASQYGPLPFSYSGQNLTTYSSEYYLESGVGVIEGTLCNPTNETVLANVNYGKISINATLEKNSCWSFGDLGGVVIYPQNTGTEIIFKESRYYETNKWLMIKLAGNCSSPVEMLSPAPSRITGISSSWNYDYDLGKAIITPLACSDGYLSIDFSSYPSGQGNVFIEDYTAFEELNWKLRYLGSEISAARNYNRDLAKMINITYTDSIALESNVSKAINEKNSFAIYLDTQEDVIEEIGDNISRTENILSTSTVINGVQFFLIIAIILAMAIYVVMYFIRDFSGNGYGN